MGRPERSIPPTRQGTLVEITGRTIGARALLVPAPNPRRFNNLVVGLLGRAMEYSPIELCACVFTSNHWHALFVVYDQQELSRFMFHFAGNSSKKIGKLRQWQGAFWQRRYDAIRVSDEPEAQWNRLKYLLSHGVKEGLVESPLQWPGIHAAGPLVRGEKLEGTWFNKTQESAARNRGEDVGAYDFATQYQIDLAPLPAFRHLEPETYREKIAELIVEIQEEGKAKHGGNPVAGVEKILSLNPQEPPTRIPKTSPKPRFHAASKQARKDLWQEVVDFAKQYRMASESLRTDRNPEAVHWFPPGSYPPAFPFLGNPPPRRPPSPPTRRRTILESGVIERGEIPVVEIPLPSWAQAREPPRVRGQPD